MREKEVLTDILHFLRSVVLIDLGIFAAVGLVCWFGGWRTAYQYGGGLTLAGMAAIALGVFSVIGGWGTTRSFEYVYGQSVSEQDIHERTRQTMKDILQSYGFLIRMTAAGVVSLAIGALFQAISR